MDGGCAGPVYSLFMHHVPASSNHSSLFRWVGHLFLVCTGEQRQAAFFLAFAHLCRLKETPAEAL